jgi:hypothetical protein
VEHLYAIASMRTLTTQRCSLVLKGGGLLRHHNPQMSVCW